MPSKAFHRACPYRLIRLLPTTALLALDEFSQQGFDDT